ncbi:acyl-CoA synthetase [Mycolicibacterium rhodesiae]|uniref:Long-chain-fatty-acid--CoA ligase FadD13 n=1 Tax=Mycolicibacterium rhodesiae TaxID=36814 RepID=A0A1X0IZA3_MYCRH|nr:acyl-CoA synthetase [Mycolicibacterium rhodesiae]MCV7345061.1 acyl-CoA synthetase [Mycolicibacterium rhodesiae]ORB54710.1 acyl-CoA synthetase [Mycolicibacterium rhodesiae]
MSGQLVNLLRAVAVLQRRRMINLANPAELVTAAKALRHYGSFGGLVTYTAARHGDSPALTDDRGTLTFRELDQLSNAVARVLVDLRLGGGSTIGLLNRSHRGVMVGLAAAGKAGVRTVLLNTGFAGPQLRDVCVRERVSLVLADQEFSDAFAALSDGVDVLLNWADEAPTRPTLDDLASSRSADPMPYPPRPGGVVLLTSGTTGTPKGAPRDRISPVQSAQLLDRIPWPANGCYVVAAPLFHATGLATTTVGLALGNHIVLSRRFDPLTALAAIEQHRAGAIVLVPTMLSRILDLGPDIIGRYDTSSLRVIFAAGSALSPQVCRRTSEAFGDVLYNLYGSTEVATAAVATPGELRAAPGTVGRPPVGCRIAAYDANDRLITRPGQSGTLYVSSGLSFSGYTDGGSKKVIDGLLSSGDTGHFDDQGLWFVDGRDDDMIVSGGENVYPVEVENLLSEHPSVAEAAVVGMPDDDFGQRLCAYVVVRDGAGLGADDVKDYVRNRLARHKIPRDVVFVDALPRNETGKVLKKLLMAGRQSD